MGTEKTFAIDIRLIGKKRTGDEAVFFNLTKALLARDTSHRYVLVTDEGDRAAVSAIRKRLGCDEQENVEIISLGGHNRFVWNFFSVPLFLLRRRIDVYHTQYILPFFVPRRTKVVEHIHDVSFSAHPEMIGWKDRLFLWLLIPRSIRRASLILTPSHFTKDEIIKYYKTPEEKIVVVPNAVGEDFSVPIDDGTIARVREKYALPEKYLLYVGTLQPRKNIPFLIEAFALFQKRVSNTGLVIVGNRRAHHTDTRLDAVLKRTSSQKSIFFPGFIDQADLPSVIGGASVFVFPSLYEGFGIPMLEAFSCSVPVVAADIPSLREIGGEAALYFDPTNLADCTEKLYTLSVDQERRRSSVLLGKERVRAFSWEKSAEILLSAYERIS